MYSRRTFLRGLAVLIPLLVVPTTLLNSFRKDYYNKRNEKFIKQGWVLQEGDV
jgi:hypothetical protein